MSTADTRDIVIIGSGPAGLTAALYAARAGLKPLLIEGLQAGGQLMTTTLVENWPGHKDGVMGPDLMMEMRAQAERFGTEIVSGLVTSVDLSQRPFRVGCGESAVLARALIIATGASARMLGLPAEQKLLGHGVSTCATCDGFFFRGRQVAVIGGGDTAMEEAIYLAKLASKVTVVHRRDSLRASKAMQDRAFADPKIEFLWDTVVEDIHDVESGVVTGMSVLNLKTEERRTIPIEGFFVAIGHTPNTSLFAGQLDMHDNGYLVTHHNVRTNVAGVFACGDVQDHIYRQAITAAGSGCMAAMEAERFLSGVPGHVEAAEIGVG